MNSLFFHTVPKFFVTGCYDECYSAMQYGCWYLGAHTIKTRNNFPTTVPHPTSIYYCFSAK